MFVFAANKKENTKNREFNLFVVVVLVATMLIFKVNVKVTLKIATRPAIKFKKKKTAKIKKHTNKKNLQNYLLFRISYTHTHSLTTRKKVLN